MIENKLEKIEHEINALKSVSPVSLGTLEGFSYGKSLTRVAQAGTETTFRARFLPTDKEQLGIYEVFLSVAVHYGATSDYYLYIDTENAYSLDDSGAAISKLSTTPNGDGERTMIAKVFVFSNTPGELILE